MKPKPYEKVIPDSLEIDERELGELVGVTFQRLRQIESIPAPKARKFPAKDTIRRLFLHYRNTGGDMRDERLKLMQLRRQREEIEMEKTVGNLCYTKQVSKLWDATVLEARAIVQAADIPEHTKKQLIDAWRSIFTAEYLGGERIEDIGVED
jgi:hypothetical protein